MTKAIAAVERRVLVLAPTGKDAVLTQSVLGKLGIDCEICPDPGAVAEEIGHGAGALLVAEEAIGGQGVGALASAVGRQPSWSDLPVLVLTRQGAESPSASRALELLGNVTLLERPVRIATLASAVRTALRARDRQYLARAHLLEREEANNRKDEFLATLSHELRNPLAPLRNAVEIIRHSAGNDPDTSNLCGMMERQLSHMVRLVDDLLEVSRFTRGKIELRKERVDLAAVIKAAVEASRPGIEAARHSLRVELPPQPLHLLADATRLAQVFGNLLNNAAKFTDAGGSITLSAARDGNAVTILVRDTGVGIPAPFLHRIFDMFVQADEVRSRAHGGLGIGLTLVRTLVELHGGSVTALSDGPGKGSEFAVRLPLASEAGKVSDKPAASDSAGTLAQQRILVVDDNQDAAETLGMLLTMLGAAVAIAHDGPAALEAVSVHRPQVVFLDLGMPGMDGYEVARRIREDSQARAATLIALSGWGQEKDRHASKAAGFDYHLIKPAEIDAVTELLRSAAIHREGAPSRTG